MKRAGKTLLKLVLCMTGALFAIIFVFWLCLHYEMNNKKTVCDTSDSLDGKYKLILLAIGEPDFPFGSADGRLLLKEGENKISETDFELRNDGASIGANCWKVTWHGDYAEVILSGKEQFDEQIILYFDGTIERRQLSNSA